MRYLTKEWYKISQQTFLYSGKRVHQGANVMDDALYLRLYQRKEKEFVRGQREIYDYDPRVGLEQMVQQKYGYMEKVCLMWMKK